MVFAKTPLLNPYYRLHGLMGLTIASEKLYGYEAFPDRLRGKHSGISKPVVWGARGLHPEFSWHFRGFRDFR